jgi:acyl-CoA synthetase (AMP-forming)/AMP-acid ligase II
VVEDRRQRAAGVVHGAPAGTGKLYHMEIGESCVGAVVDEVVGEVGEVVVVVEDQDDCDESTIRDLNGAISLAGSLQSFLGTP